MFASVKKLSSLPGKLAGQAEILRHDPERFARNLTQYTHPGLFEKRLLDLHNAVPVNMAYSASHDGPLRLNVLDADWTVTGMTGGPNTVVNLACRIARQGISVRLVATVGIPTINPGWFQTHAESLLGGRSFPGIEIVSAAQHAPALPIGPRDVFLATHWSTALQLKPVLPLLPIRQFFYMLQEFEPGFYAWSSNFALALETFSLDFWPIINQSLLAGYLLTLPFGRLSDPVTRERAMVFEPAVDASVFYPGPLPAMPRPKRLLFYARPTNTRNMFGIGLNSLAAAAADPAFAGWEFVSIGSRGSLPEMPLGHEHVLRCGPWMDYAGYGALLRDADVLLCPMLSPHTSYPVLEMAASGGIAVTNTFLTKTEAALQAISPSIIAVEPTMEGFTTGLVRAAGLVNMAIPREAQLNMPRDWDISLDHIAQRITEVSRGLDT
jgi:beta-1,2-rhamnosyltransferase WsaF-like protein